MRVGKRSGKCAQDPGLELLPDVAKNNNVAMRLRNECIQHYGFASTLRENENAETLVRHSEKLLCSAVGRSIGSDEDLYAFGRIVECEQIFDLRDNRGCFVVRGKDDADVRFTRLLPPSARTDSTPQSKQRRIPDKYVSDQAQ